MFRKKLKDQIIVNSIIIINSILLEIMFLFILVVFTNIISCNCEFHGLYNHLIDYIATEAYIDPVWSINFPRCHYCMVYGSGSLEDYMNCQYKDNCNWFPVRDFDWDNTCHHFTNSDNSMNICKYRFIDYREVMIKLYNAYIKTDQLEWRLNLKAKLVYTACTMFDEKGFDYSYINYIKFIHGKIPDDTKKILFKALIANDLLQKKYIKGNDRIETYKLDIVNVFNEHNYGTSLDDLISYLKIVKKCPAELFDYI